MSRNEKPKKEHKGASRFNHSGGSRKDHQYHGNNFQSNCSRVHESGIPYLVYGKSTNFAEYRRKLSSVALEKCPIIGNIIEDKQYEDFEDVEPDDDELADDPHGIKMRELQERVSQKVKKQAAAEQEKTKLFGIMIGTLSRESEQRLMQLETWDNIKHS